MLALTNKTNAVGSVLARISPVPEVSSFALGGMTGRQHTLQIKKQNE
jgi:hypothetical protein